jgi:hypothetical protein
MRRAADGSVAGCGDAAHLGRCAGGIKFQSRPIFRTPDRGTFPTAGLTANHAMHCVRRM